MSSPPGSTEGEDVAGGESKALALDVAGETNRVVARNSLLTLADTGVGLIVSIGTAGIVARVLGPVTMGQYAFPLWLATTMGAFASHGVGATIWKYVAEHMGRDDLPMSRAIAKAAYRLQWTSALILTTISMAYVWWRIPENMQLYNAVVLLTIIPSLMVIVPTMLNAAAEDFRANVIPGMVATLLQPLGIVFALVLKWELTGLAAGQLLARTTDAGMRMWLARKRFPPDTPKIEIPPELRKRMWSFCWQSSMLLVLDLIVWEKCELFFLKKFSSWDQLSFYSTGFQLTNILMSLPASFAWAATAALMVRQGRDPRALKGMVGISLRYAALLVFPLTFGMAALSGSAVNVIFGPRYLPAIPVVALMAVMSIPKALFSPAQSILKANEKQSFMLRWMIVSALTTVVLDVILIPEYHAMGAAWGNGLAQLIAAGGIWIYAIRQERLTLPWGALARMAASAGIMAGLVYSLTLFLPPLAAALVGVPTGALLYGALLRITRSFYADDRGRFLSLQSQLPAVLRPWYVRGVGWVLASASDVPLP